MTSVEADVGRRLLRGFVRLVVRATVRPMLGPPLPLSLRRRWIDAAAVVQRPPAGTGSIRGQLGGVPVVRFRHRRTDPDRVVLYLHGGGYEVGSARSHAALAGALAEALRAEVVVPEYRLAPEHPFPAAREDALAVHGALVSSGRAPFLIAGDSAGGGLTLATAIALRDAGRPLPDALALLSPWTDLTMSGDSVRQVGRRDPMLRIAGLRAAAANYLAGRPADEPGPSPLFADLTGLPPMVVHVASQELLRDDAHRLAEAARAAGVHVDLRTYPRLWHVHHVHVGMLPDARDAVEDLAAAVETVTARAA